MKPVIETRDLTRRFGDVTALDRVTLAIPPGRIVGLIGRNGSGKTTLLRHVAGLYVPSEGSSSTFGRPSAELSGRELGRIGLVQQEERFLHWMTVREHLDHVAAFHPRWDRALEARLVNELDVELDKQVGTLSPGNAQKLAVLLGLCHRPELLLLDEPVSALDPIARERMLALLLELLNTTEATIVVSSHVLRDVERVVDWIVCLDRGRVVADVALDELQERFTEWNVRAERGLPSRFDDPFVREQAVDGAQARLVVEGGAECVETFRTRYGAEVEASSLNLERIFPFLLEEEEAVR